jgi:hypothetical protein
MEENRTARSYIRLKRCAHLFACVEFCSVKNFDFHVDEYSKRIYLFDNKSVRELWQFILNCEYRGACIVNIIPDVVPE